MTGGDHSRMKGLGGDLGLLLIEDQLREGKKVSEDSKATWILNNPKDPGYSLRCYWEVVQPSMC